MIEHSETPLKKYLIWVVVLGVLVLAFSNSRYATFEFWQHQENGVTRSEVVRNLGLLFVAVVGTIFAGLRWMNLNQQAKTAERQADIANEQARIANAQAALAERGQITDRFSSAVEQLGSDKLPVRLGGIYGLWRVAQIANIYERESMLDVLAGFARFPIEDKNLTETCAHNNDPRPDVYSVIYLGADIDKENSL